MIKNKSPNKLEKEGKTAFKKGDFVEAEKLFHDAELSYIAIGENLAAAVDAVLEGKQVNQEQKPSMGCNIKWKQNE